MQLFDAEVEEMTLFRVYIPNEEVREVLDVMGFEEHGGEMSLYQERYADVDRILQVIERENLEDEIKEKNREALMQIKALAEELEDGTIVFVEA